MCARPCGRQATAYTQTGIRATQSLLRGNAPMRAYEGGQNCRRWPREYVGHLRVSWPSSANEDLTARAQENPVTKVVRAEEPPPTQKSKKKAAVVGLSGTRPRQNNAGPMRMESCKQLAREAIWAIPAALELSPASAEPKVEDDRGMAFDADARHPCTARADF